jgi:hypothetical protein
MGKNAYEIRLESLNLAYTILSDQRHSDLHERRQNLDEASRLHGRKKEGQEPALPEPVHPETVLEAAAKLYAFIEKGGAQNGALDKF